MTFTVALFILAIGIAIGYRLPGPVARLKAFYRRMTYKPVLLKPFDPGTRDASKQARDAR
jgi:hypothetical protein